MKRTVAAPLAAILLASAPAFADADAYDCFPLCQQEQPQAAPKIDLCEHAAVREVAQVNRELAPVKKAVDIALNPEGFALEMVDRHVVHIPPVVGFAMNPRGTIKAKVMERVRDEVKKEVGLEHECVAEAEAPAP